MGFVKGSLILHMGHSRGAGHARIMQQASLVTFFPFSFAQDSGDDNDIYQRLLSLHPPTPLKLAP